jgi:hypothetical protein
MAGEGRGRDLDRLAALYADEQNKKLNLSLRGREKVFGDPDAEALAGREARMTSMSSSSPCGPGYEYITAPQDPNKTRHRAEYACYSLDPELKVLAIGMRDGSLIQYNKIEPEIWDALKGSTSTNDFIGTYLLNWPWTKTDYQNLPRKRPEEFQLGSGL